MRALVEFISNALAGHCVYSAGERAAFSVNEAKALVEKGEARIVKHLPDTPEEAAQIAAAAIESEAATETPAAPEGAAEVPVEAGAETGAAGESEVATEVAEETVAETHSGGRNRARSRK